MAAALPNSIKLEAPDWPPSGAPKCPRKRQKRQMHRDIDRFPPKPLSRLSYQAHPIPRIFPFSSMPVGGDRRLVFIFAPVETT
jgi:hypothetical protein